MVAPDLETVVSLAKRRGFIFPSAEIYGGFANTYDYGPLGVELKRNIREAWWRSIVRLRDDVVLSLIHISEHTRQETIGYCGV